ncbi:MAG: hypothetical protein GEU78_14450 [Actinobacteria bacterium]|nr:hypothetical protein [Actinomycetota bacterium]
MEIRGFAVNGIVGDGGPTPDTFEVDNPGEEGDRLVSVFFGDPDGLVSQLIIPSGWTVDYAEDTGNGPVIVSSHVADDPITVPSYTFGMGPGSAMHIHASIWAVVDAEAGFDVAPADTTGASGSPTLPAVTTLTDGAILIGGFAARSGDAFANDTPAEMTMRTNAAIGDTFMRVYFADEARPTAGSVGTRSAAIPGAPAWMTTAFALAEALPDAVMGDLVADLPALEAQLVGALTVAGDLNAALPTLTASFEGNSGGLVDGDLDATLPALTAAATGTVTVSGQLTATLPALAAALQAETTIFRDITVTVGPTRIGSVAVGLTRLGWAVGPTRTNRGA